MFGTEGASKPTISLVTLSRYCNICEGCVAYPRYPITKLLQLLASRLAKTNPIIILVLVSMVLVHIIQLSRFSYSRYRIGISLLLKDVDQLLLIFNSVVSQLFSMKY